MVLHPEWFDHACGNGDDFQIPNGPTFTRAEAEAVREEDKQLVGLCLQCRDGWGNTTWPDGRALLYQPTRLSQAFATINGEIQKYKDSK